MFPPQGFAREPRARDGVMLTSSVPGTVASHRQSVINLLSPRGTRWQRDVVLRDGFWSDPSASDWIAAAGGFAGFLALLLEVWRSRRRRRQPPDELLGQLVELHGWFQAVIVHGERDSDWFRDPDRPQREILLAVISGQLADNELFKLVRAARTTWMDCVALAPDPGISHADPARQRQLDAAGKGMRATAKAIDRANKLMRRRP
jgi:hypothetical protein